MAKRYNYSRVFQGPSGPETFSCDGADSFEEAKKIVDKGVYDRQLQVTAESTVQASGGKGFGGGGGEGTE